MIQQPADTKTQQSGELSGHLLLLLAGLAALGSLATNIILPTFPDMARELGTSVKDLSATLASFLAAFAVGQPFVGPLSDRFGLLWCLVPAFLHPNWQIDGGRFAPHGLAS